MDFNHRTVADIESVRHLPYQSMSLLQATLACKKRKQNLHPWVRVDQAVLPLAPKTLSILIGLALKLISLCNHN